MKRSGRPLRRAPVLVLALALFGCGRDEPGYDHSQEHVEGHDHHEQNHGHEAPMRRVTLFSDRLEVFVEHESAVAGRKLTLLAHVTVLDGFRPLTEGRAQLALSGPSPIHAEAAAPIRPGSYAFELTPEAAGRYQGRLTFQGAIADSVEGLEIEVKERLEEALTALPDEHDGTPIELFKEQQWAIPFATAFAARGTLAPSIEVSGTVTTAPGGSAQIGAPVTGRLVIPREGLPRPGDSVRKGQTLASLQPSPSSPEDAARAGLAVAEAEARAAAAKLALERAERLFADRAIPRRELEDARRELALANQAVSAARDAQGLFQGATRGGGRGSYRLVAPIDGTLVSVDATPGATVQAGEVLFRLVDTRELWIRARVPEQDAARLRTDRDASYRIAGLDEFRPIRLSGEDATASVVTVGRTVDPISRTVDVIYALRDPDPALRVGGLVTVSIPAGPDFSGVVVPSGALVDQEGRDVVYVQLDGEHFEARPVRVGPRAGERVGILQGLEPGERIVTRGAHIVRLADRPESDEPHGHIH